LTFSDEDDDEDDEESDQEGEGEDGDAVRRGHQLSRGRSPPGHESAPRDDEVEVQETPPPEVEDVQAVSAPDEDVPEDDLFGPDPDDYPPRPSDTQRTLVATQASPQAESSKPIMAARRRRQKSPQDTSSRRSPTREFSEPVASPQRPFIQQQPPRPRSSSRQPPTSQAFEELDIETDSDSPDEWDEDLEAPSIRSIREPEEMEDDFNDLDVSQEEDQVAVELMESASTGPGTAARPSRNSPSVQSDSSSTSPPIKRKNGSEGGLSEDDEQTEQALAGGRPHKVPRSSWNPTSFERRLTQTFTPVRHSQHTISGPRRSGPRSMSSADVFPPSGTKARRVKEAQKDEEYSPPANTRASQLRKSMNWSQ
jgi:hypothetical protein